MSFGMISYVREKQRKREITPAKPPRAVIRVADLFAKRGSNHKEMSTTGLHQCEPKKPQDSKNPAAFISDLLFALSPRRPRDQPYANRQCLCNKQARDCQV